MHPSEEGQHQNDGGFIADAHQELDEIAANAKRFELPV
jgi:hypothetical protein